MKRWNSVMDVAAANVVFARTSGKVGKAAGISAFLVPAGTPGMEVDYYHWTFNMPTDHAETSLKNVRVPAGAMLGEEGRGLDCAQLFVHENRIRQAASSLGAAQFCIDASIAYAQERIMFGKPLAATRASSGSSSSCRPTPSSCATRSTRSRGRWTSSATPSTEAKTAVTDKVSMVNYRGNQLACNAADRAIQIHGGVGYSRHKPFEHIYRHHRRYRITEGSDELQLRRIAGKVFGFSGGANSRSPLRCSDRGQANGVICSSCDGAVGSVLAAHVRQSGGATGAGVSASVRSSPAARPRYSSSASSAAP